ncbi:nitroimidazol reductase NimA-like FMN-containing flavoprotein (pyridoxamine 5'-phosphate oxidase superfamily) [Catenulispora sp. GAS73]|uniref:pyridoxamine 5'-phosphate oxidase family protein n=1 Tax=Catenulispora sp. GAS73 TaxID=3156269 RepID=UPI003515BE92
MTDPMDPMDTADTDLAGVARGIIEANVYVTIACVDEHGSAWASPVFYATDDAVDFYWMSSPLTRHSRALAVRPEVSLLIFDSQVAPLTGDALVMTADAVQIADEDEQGLARALAVYPGAAERGGRPVRLEQVSGDSPYRMYRARAREWFVQCPWGDGGCVAHGWEYDHRIAVDLAAS